KRSGASWVIAVSPHQRLRALLASRNRKRAPAGSRINSQASSTRTQRRRSGPSSWRQIASSASKSAGGFSRSGRPRRAKQTSGAAASGQVERVERHRLRAGERQVDAAHRLGQPLVLALGVEHVEPDAAEEQAQGFELGQVALAGAGAGEQDAVVVLAREAVEED